ncbi:MAG TPA: DUF916 domain-containing protein [Candidatus Saccharimonadales bacterium]|nr:DUF916 domain-containing protein [Candidatus Saccharimonadales bacterium]
MVRRRILTAVVVVMVAVSSLVGLAPVGTAFAAQTAAVGGNALKISPVRADVEMDPGTSKVFDVTITNLTSVPAALHGAVNDFTTGDEQGHPNIILDENQSAPSHSLKQFTQPIGNFTLAPGAQKDVKVSITVPKGAAGGGYYGAVRFYPQATGDKNLNLAASVGTLVLLKVNGAVIEKLNMASFDIRRGDNSAVIFTSGKGLVSVSRFQNTGNVQLEPFGKMVLKRFGKQVATFEVNTADPKSNVLPDGIRRFDTHLSDVGSFGKFSLEGNFGYGTTGQLLTAKVTFYVIPVSLVITIGAILVVLVALIFLVPRALRNYNRRVLRRASRRR